jgi:hypothetical protein
MDKERSATHIMGATLELRHKKRQTSFSFSLFPISPNNTLLNMSVAKSSRQHFSRAILADLHKWWFKDVPSKYDVPVSEGTLQRWFRPDPEVDEYCGSV